MTKEQYERIPLMLQTLDDEAKVKFQEYCSHLVLEKKRSLSATFNFSTEIIFVEKGWLCLQIGGAIVSILQAGDTFFSPGPSDDSNSAPIFKLTAATPSVVVTAPVSFLREALKNSPETIFDLLARTTSRSIRALVNLAQQHDDSLDVRLSTLLWSLSVPRHDGHRIVPAINQTILASCLSTGREEVNRKRRLLIQQGLLFRHHGIWLISRDVGRVLVARGFGA